MKQLTKLLILICLLIIFSTCKKEDTKTAKMEFIVVEVNQESDWDYWIIGKDGDSYFIKLQNLKPNVLLYKPDVNNDGFPIFLDDNGRPLKTIIHDNIILFGNYKTNSVDVSVIRPNGEILLYRNISTEYDWSKISLKSINLKSSSSNDIFKLSAIAISTTTCVLGIIGAIPTSGLSLFMGCGSVFLTAVATAQTEKYEFVGLAGTAMGTFATVYGCINTVELTSCFLGILSKGFSITSTAIQDFDNNKDKINLAQAQLINAGLIAYYPFNGNANDESGNANNGTIYGGVTLTSDRHGNNGKAMHFNGSNGYIQVPNSSSLQSPENAMSITGWIWIDGYNGLKAAGIVNKTNTSNYGQYGLSYHEWSNPYRINFNYNQGSKGCSTSISLVLSKWYFLAATFDGSSIIIYLNGIKIDSQASTGLIIKDNNPLTIGLESPGDVEYLKGKLDDIRIFNRALSQQEIQSFNNE